jgi:L-threonylcarbamoyladenylate synthase
MLMSNAVSTDRKRRARVLAASPHAIDEAASLLRSGGVVAIPTETVYGLAALASNADAVASVFAFKGRPSINPLICHVSSPEMAARHAIVTPEARSLMDAFWPGPLTIVAPKRADGGICEAVSAGLPSIALRMPAHPVAIEIIERSGGPVAAPSANVSERLSPTTAEHVLRSLGDRIDLIIDGGRCEKGIESTILMQHETGWRLLRPGPIEPSQLESFTGPLMRTKDHPTLLAPGMMRRHYAPDARLRLNAREAFEGEAFLAFGEPPEGVVAHATLSASGSLEEAASNLFAMLRYLDAHHSAIAVAVIPDDGIGEAINDRLKRAAAKKIEDGVRQIR